MTDVVSVAWSSDGATNVVCFGEGVRGTDIVALSLRGIADNEVNPS